MLRMMGYEWKKIWRNRLTFLAVLGCAVFLLLCVYATITQIFTQDETGQMVYGQQAVEILKNTRERQTLTQEKIDGLVTRYLEYTKNPETGSDKEEYEYLTEETYYTFLVPNRDLFNLISYVYGYDGRTSMKTVLEANAGKDFYQARLERDRQYIEKQKDEGRLTAAEAAYWEKESEKTGVYDYGYCKGWDTILDSMSWPIFLMMIICIGAAPVFAGEYQTGCDSLLLCMKYGKNKLIASKIAAVWLFASCIYWGVMLGCCGAILAALGTDGGDLPIQIRYPSYTVNYPLTMKEAVFLDLVLAYVLVLGVVGFTLFLSSVQKNAYGVIVIDFLFLVVPFILDPERGSYLWCRLVALLPEKIADFVHSSHISYDLGGWVLNWPQMAILVNGAGAVILSCVGYWCFRKHQVNK